MHVDYRPVAGAASRECMLAPPGRHGGLVQLALEALRFKRLDRCPEVGGRHKQVAINVNPSILGLEQPTCNARPLEEDALDADGV